jgi:hypothetical protein
MPAAKLPVDEKVLRKRAKDARWRAANRDEGRARAEAWRLLNPERYRALWTAYYQAHREQILAAKRARYEQDADLRERLRQKNRAWHAANRVWRQAYERERKYGLTTAAIEKLFAAQDGRCAICEQPAELGKLVPDHDHESGAVRGLVHHGCNHWLKAFERPGFAEQARHYLQQL